MSREKIAEDTTLEEVLRHREAIPILMKYGLPCPTCPLAQFEMSRLKIGDITRRYGIDVNSLLKELNEVIRGC